MKKYLLTMLVVLCCNMLFAQRYNISSEEGAKGLIIAGILFGLVALITIVIYFKQRRVDK